MFECTFFEKGRYERRLFGNVDEFLVEAHSFFKEILESNTLEVQGFSCPKNFSEHLKNCIPSQHLSKNSNLFMKFLRKIRLHFEGVSSYSYLDSSKSVLLASSFCKRYGENVLENPGVINYILYLKWSDITIPLEMLVVKSSIAGFTALQEELGIAA